MLTDDFFGGSFSKSSQRPISALARLSGIEFRDARDEWRPFRQILVGEGVRQNAHREFRHFQRGVAGVRRNHERQPDSRIREVGGILRQSRFPFERMTTLGPS